MKRLSYLVVLVVLGLLAGCKAPPSQFEAGSITDKPKVNIVDENGNKEAMSSADVEDAASKDRKRSAAASLGLGK